jgi:AcrR family transcriptional regulator
MQEQGPGAGKRSIDAAHARARCRTAMLELSGEIGYRSVTVEKVLSHSGVSLRQFEAEFGDLEGCFAAAYEAEADALCEAMLVAARQGDGWRAGVRAALATLLRFVSERPLVAKALVRDVYVVGGRALTKHEEVLTQLSAALERHTQLPAEQPGETSNFIVGAIEGVVAARLAREQPEDIPALLPELMYLVVVTFEGRGAAAEETEDK